VQGFTIGSVAQMGPISAGAAAPAEFLAQARGRPYVATEAAGHVLQPTLRLQQLGKADQDLVGEIVAVPIIHQLERVQVNHRCRDRTLWS